MMQNLFPTPVGIYNIEREITEEEIEFLKNLETKENEGNWTSQNRNILECDVLKDIRNFIQEKLDEYFSEVYRPQTEVNLKMTQTWSNYTKPGEYHHRHSHPNSFVSAVFYPYTDSDKDRIYFFHSKGYEQIKIKTDDFNLWNSESWWLPAKVGDLIIFPSSLTHQVPTTESADTRISIAVNTFPVGHIGFTEELTALYVKDVK